MRGRPWSQERCLSTPRNFSVLFFDNFLPIFLFFTLSGIPIGWTFDSQDWLSIFLISSILMFISLTLAPVFGRFSWHFHQAFYSIFHFYYSVVKIEALFILVAPSYVILFCFVDSISCFASLKTPVMKSLNALLLSLFLLRFLFSVFVSVFALGIYHRMRHEDMRGSSVLPSFTPVG